MRLYRRLLLTATVLAFAVITPWALMSASPTPVSAAPAGRAVTATGGEALEFFRGNRIVGVDNPDAPI